MKTRGFSGRTHTAETRAKMSAARAGKPLSLEHRAKISEAKTGYTHTPESRAKMSAWQIGSTLSPDRCARIAAANTGRIHSAETHAKISAGIRLAIQKGRRRFTGVRKSPPPITLEYRAKLCEARKRRVFSAETIAKISASNTGLKRHEGFGAAVAERNRARVVSQETREKMRVIHKAAYADGRSSLIGHVPNGCRYTKLAQALHVYLEARGAALEVEVRFGRFTVDLYDRSNHVAYEADGSFWHERKESTDPGWHAARDNYLMTVHGLKVVHYTDKEIRAVTDYGRKKRAVAS